MITTPVNAATVSGVVPVVASVTVPQGTTDYPDQTLYVDGEPLGDPQPCLTSGATTCTATFELDTRALNDGMEFLQIGPPYAGSSVMISVTVDNASPASPTPSPSQTPTPAPTTAAPVMPAPTTPAPTTSAAPPIQPLPRPATIAHISAPASLTLTHGATARLQGTVTDAATLQPLAMVPVTVTFTPRGGAVSVVTVVSDVHGDFMALDPHPVSGATAVTATTSAADGNGVAHLVIAVAVPVTCASSTPKRGGAVVSCAVPGLPSGATVTLHYSSGASHGVVTATAKAGRATFTLARPRHAWTTVWITTRATHTLVASQSRRYSVRIS